MWTYPEIDPVAIQLGPLAVQWYGLTYLTGFFFAWLILRARNKRAVSPWPIEQIEELIFYCALGVILGGRVGYVLFYSFDNFLADPLLLIRIWQGGMSFHGGLLGVSLAMVLFARRFGHQLFDVSDKVALVTPIGLGAGRLGNFINGELWGRPTDGPWGMVFPHVDGQARHPSQLYEFALEGVLLFILLNIYAKTSPPTRRLSGGFLLGYGVFRGVIEFAREPDTHIGYIAFNWLTMGQMLCLPMIIIGVVLIMTSKSKNQETAVG